MYDLLIRSGRIIDGTGNPWYQADLAVSGHTIEALAKLPSSSAHRVIDADGLVVCPGFVDMHVHSDLTLLAEPEALPRVRQGVTTDVIGQDGFSFAPVSPGNMAFWREKLAGGLGDFDLSYRWSSVAQYLDEFDRGVAINVAFLVPHSNVRLEVMGLEARRPKTAELMRMRQLVAQGIGEGAFGLSSGLFFVPGMYADTEELIELCRPVAQQDGLYVSHIRSYTEGIDEAFEEVCCIAQRSGVRAHISHFNTTLEKGASLIESARRRGIDLTYDTYPYTAGCRLLGAMLPMWVQEGTVEQSVERLRSQEGRERLCQAIEDRQFAHSGPDTIWIADARRDSNQRYVGLSLTEAAALSGTSLGDFVVDLLIEERFAVPTIAQHTHRTEEDMIGLMQRREQIVGSDGVMVGKHPHPRGYGTFPRILGYYVREAGALDLEAAVRKMTWAPACRLGLKDRGLLLQGWKADITCFNPDTVIDRATYAQATLSPEGICHVVVNGQLVIENGQHTGKLPGRALRK